MSHDLVLRSRRVFLPEGERPAAVRVSEGRIAAIEPYEGSAGLDLGDLALLPGLVDTHVHVNEPGRTEWEGFASATRSAAAGGVTTIIDMPLNSIPPTVTVSALEVKREAAADQCHVDVGFWGGAVPDNRGDLRALHEAGVFGFKSFLVDSGVPEFPPLTPPHLDAAMRTVDALFVVHAEDPESLRPAAASRRYADFVTSRPAESEESAVAAVIRAGRSTGGRAHILHLSAASALPLLAEAKREGARLTAETCPHYLTLRAEDVPDGATEYKCCPPIRDGDNQEMLWRGLVAGTIDCVVSDHSPCTPDLKRPDVGDFAAAWGGIASLQLGLAAVWSHARDRGHGLGDVVRWMADRPADLVGLSHKGRIAVGGDADLVAFAPDEEFTVEPGGLHHRHAVTPYAGQTLFGVVRQTWLRGESIFVRRVAGAGEHGHARGRLLRREER